MGTGRTVLSKPRAQYHILDCFLSSTCSFFRLNQTDMDSDVRICLKNLHMVMFDYFQDNKI